MEKNHLPFGSEFSPSVIELPVLLTFCAECGGDKTLLEGRILETFFMNKGGENEANRRKLAMNCRLGLKAYGIIDNDAQTTPLFDALFAVKDDESRLYTEFARHILLNLNGMGLIQCIRDMEIAEEPVTLETLRTACREHGLHYPAGGKHPSMMRLWLSKAGVFEGSRWKINEARIKEILGQNDSLETLRGLSPLQRVFLQSLLNTGNPDFQKASGIVKLAEATYGARFPEKSLPKLCLNALLEKGFIAVERTTSGRGAKSPLVKPTEKANREIVLPFLEQLKSQTDPKLVELLQKPLSEILANLKSDDRYIAGLALEALAFKLMRILGMDYVATRLRAEKTGGAEVDLVFESTRLVFSRWQIQCKNTAHVSLEDVAKEVGLTHMLKSNVIVMVSTGAFSRDAYMYSNSVLKSSNLCIVFVERADIERIADDPYEIVEVFNRQAKATMTLKKLSEDLA